MQFQRLTKQLTFQQFKESRVPFDDNDSDKTVEEDTYLNIQQDMYQSLNEVRKLYLEEIMPYLEFLDFYVIQILGNGTFGKVLQIIHKHTKKPYACKFFQLQEDYQLEKETMTKLQHKMEDSGIHYEPIIAKMVDYSDEAQLIFLETGQCSLKDLSNEMAQSQIYWFENLQYFYDVIVKVYNKLNVLMGQNVYHSDIKPDNIVMMKNHTLLQLEPKIIDFGISTVDDYTKIIGCTPQFIKEESFRIKTRDQRKLWELYQLGRTVQKLMQDHVEKKIAVQMEEFKKSSFVKSKYYQNFGTKQQDIYDSFLILEIFYPKELMDFLEVILFSNDLNKIDQQISKLRTKKSDFIDEKNLIKGIVEQKVINKLDFEIHDAKTLFREFDIVYQLEMYEKAHIIMKIIVEKMDIFKYPEYIIKRLILLNYLCLVEEKEDFIEKLNAFDIKQNYQRRQCNEKQEQQQFEKYYYEIKIRMGISNQEKKVVQKIRDKFKRHDPLYIKGLIMGSFNLQQKQSTMKKFNYNSPYKKFLKEVMEYQDGLIAQDLTILERIQQLTERAYAVYYTSHDFDEEKGKNQNYYNTNIDTEALLQVKADLEQEKLQNSIVYAVIIDKIAYAKFHQSFERDNYDIKPVPEKLEEVIALYNQAAFIIKNSLGETNLLYFCLIQQLAYVYGWLKDEKCISYQQHMLYIQYKNPKLYSSELYELNYTQIFKFYYMNFFPNYPIRKYIGFWDQSALICEKKRDFSQALMFTKIMKKLLYFEDEILTKTCQIAENTTQENTQSRVNLKINLDSVKYILKYKMQQAIFKCQLEYLYLDEKIQILQQIVDFQKMENYNDKDALKIIQNIRILIHNFVYQRNNIEQYLLQKKQQQINSGNQISSNIQEEALLRDISQQLTNGSAKLQSYINLMLFYTYEQLYHQQKFNEILDFQQSNSKGYLDKKEGRLVFENYYFYLHLFEAYSYLQLKQYNRFFFIVDILLTKSRQRDVVFMQLLSRQLLDDFTSNAWPMLKDIEDPVLQEKYHECLFTSKKDLQGRESNDYFILKVDQLAKQEKIHQMKLVQQEILEKKSKKFLKSYKYTQNLIVKIQQNQTQRSLNTLLSSVNNTNEQAPEKLAFSQWKIGRIYEKRKDFKRARQYYSSSKSVTSQGDITTRSTTALNRLYENNLITQLEQSMTFRSNTNRSNYPYKRLNYI